MDSEQPPKAPSPLRGRKLSAEHRAKIGASQRGKVIPDEQRAQISATLRGRKLSDEHRAKLAGRRSTPESRAKTSATLRARNPHPDTCTIDGCDRKYVARGWCITHYMRWRTNGDPLALRDISGENGSNWKGDDIKSAAMHRRLKRILPAECALANDTCKGRFESAFRHDTPDEDRLEDDAGPWSTDPDHYWTLCRSHHVRYDHGLVPGLTQKRA